MVCIGIGFGSNLGNREDNIGKAIAILEEVGFVKLSVSSYIETQAEGFESKNLFSNCVGLFETTFGPREVLAELLKTEQNLGRSRSDSKGYADRTIDLDLLFYGDLIYDDSELTLPHPRLHERAFVLIPLVEISPTWRHPILQQTAVAMLENLQALPFE